MLHPNDEWYLSIYRDMERCPDCDEFVYISYSESTGATRVKHRDEEVEIPDHFWMRERNKIDKHDYSPDARDVIHGKPDKSDKKLKVKHGN